MSDLRAPTPTAAAAAVVPDRADAVRSLQHQRTRLWLAIDSALTQRLAQFDAQRRALTRLSPVDVIARNRQQVDENAAAMHRAFVRDLRNRRDRLNTRRLQLAALNPLAILARGYAIVRKDGIAVSSIQQVVGGDSVHVRVSDGEFTARVTDENSNPGAERR